MRSPAELEGLALLGLYLASCGVILAVRARWIHRAWRRAAERLGLIYERWRRDGVDTLCGTLDGLAISVESTVDLPTDEATLLAKRCAARAENEACTRVTLSGAGQWPSGVSLHPVEGSVLDRDLPALRRRHADVVTGDEKFDSHVRIDGPAASVLAMLTHEARRSLLALDAPRPWSLVVTGALSEPVVRVFIHGELRGVAGKVRAVRLAAEIARATRLEGGIAESLDRNVRCDIPEVRLRNLSCLIDALGEGDLAVRDTCRRALQDESAEIRLMAARALGVEGVEAMLAIVHGESLPFQLRAEAFQAVLTQAGEAGYGPLVESLLDGNDADIRRLAIEAIGERRWMPALPRLLEPRRGALPAEARAIATTLGKLGDPSAEPILIEWLGSPVDAVVAASARALGAIGSVEAVEPLLPLAHAAFGASDVRAAARDALRLIRSRLGPVDAGRLALVDLDASAGALSVPDEPSGRVSLDVDALPRDESQP